MAKQRLPRLKPCEGKSNAEVIIESGRYIGARRKLMDGEPVLFIPDHSPLGHASAVVYGASKFRD